jgi:hypothetical protein
MVGDDMILKPILLILAVLIIFSGCVEKNNVNQSNAPVNQSQANLSSGEENIPEIKITSFSSIYTHDNVERIYGYLFNWDDVPGNDSQKLISYLRNDLEIDWVNSSQIIKTNDNKTIRVFTSENSVDLTLDKDENTVQIPAYYVQLDVKEENGKLCVCKLEEFKHGYNITEKYYAVYNLSIKNNGSNNLDFKLDNLHVRDRDQIFNFTVEPEGFNYLLDVFSDLQNADKIEDMTLLPGQTINGSVFCQVNSLYNESFSLMYKETPISSTSFEKSIKALKTAEYFDYSTAFGIPPYTTVFGSQSSFEPNLANYPNIGPNWINRSIFEFFNKTDSEEMLKSPPDKIARTEIVYALEAIPERNITVIPVQTRSWKNFFLVIDGIDITGEEVVNRPGINAPGVAITKQSYNLWWGVDVPQTNSSNAIFVKVSFQGNYHIEPANMRYSHVNQEVIVGNELNIIAARYHPFNAHGV